MNIPIVNNIVLVLPHEYKKLPLPGLIEWDAALRTRKDRGEGRLCRNGEEFCCLGVLSQLQGRLTPQGRDGENPTTGSLGEGNPAFPVLNRQGDFRPGVSVFDPTTGNQWHSLASVNDDIEKGHGWEIIPDILGHLYYDDPEPRYEKIMSSSVFRLDGPAIDLTQALTLLANSVHAAPEDAVRWSLGEGLEATLDDLIVGAYWALTEWHGGQESATYAAMCALGRVYSPGMEGPDRENAAYQIINQYYENQ